MNEKICKIIRVITVAPIMCLLAILCTYFIKCDYFSGVASLLSAIGFLTIFPLLSYPICYFVKPLKIKGRKMERTLAIVFAFVGYIVAFVLSFVFNDALELKIFLGTYLLSSLIILLFRIFNVFNPSGHASGIAGPITFLVIYVNYFFAFLYLLVIVVWYVSIKMKRHSHAEYIVGSLIPTIILLLSILLK